jgi:rhamnose utilization protein RhaD (predicted bifunctional aldolase and dehydrogenase)
MSEIKKFLKLSKSVGEDFNLIQGPGGNTSYKNRDLIYIKKSGTFLRESENVDIFISENIHKLGNVN